MCRIYAVHPNVKITKEPQTTFPKRIALSITTRI